MLFILKGVLVVIWSMSRQGIAAKGRVLRAKQKTDYKHGEDETDMHELRKAPQHGA